MLLILGTLLFVTNVHAECLNSSLIGRWAFTELGTFDQGNDTIHVTSIGELELDGKGNVTDGWATVKLGENVTTSDKYSGWYNVSSPCLVNFFLTRDRDIKYQLIGFISKGNKQIDSISWGKNSRVISEMSRISGRCHKSSISGIWVSSYISYLNETPSTFADTLACDGGKGTCNRYYVGNPAPQDLTNFTTNVTLDKDDSCKFTFSSPFEGRVAVPFGAGMYLIRTSPNYRYSARYERGQPGWSVMPPPGGY